MVQRALELVPVVDIAHRSARARRLPARLEAVANRKQPDFLWRRKRSAQRPRIVESVAILRDESAAFAEFIGDDDASVRPGLLQEPGGNVEPGSHHVGAAIGAGEGLRESRAADHSQRDSRVHRPRPERDEEFYRRRRCAAAEQRHVTAITTGKPLGLRKLRRSQRLTHDVVDACDVTQLGADVGLD